MVCSMDKISFNEEKMYSAYMQLQNLQEELNRISGRIRQIRQEIRDGTDLAAYVEKWSRWEQLYTHIQDQARPAARQIEQIIRIYEETERKNVRLVEQLPLLQEKGFGKNSVIPYAYPTAYRDRLAGISVGNTWSSSQLWHDAWVVRTVESTF